MTARTVREALRVPRMRLIAATLAAKRAQYPELWRAPTLAMLEDIADVEDIVINPYRLPPFILGRALRIGGVGLVTIANDVDEATQALVVLHELSHIWLGHCDDGALAKWLRGEQGPWWAVRLDGPLCSRTEDEANMLTAAILGTTHERVLARFDSIFVRRMAVDQQRAA